MGVAMLELLVGISLGELRPVLGSRCYLERVCDQLTPGAEVRVSMLGTGHGDFKWAPVASRLEDWTVL